MTKKKKIVLIDIIILVVLAIAIAVSMPFSLDIELSLGLATYEKVDGNELSADTKNAAAAADTLRVNFVDVGQGDCAIIELPDGKTMLIDGSENNRATENAIQAFIDSRLSELKYFDYAILTHPDSDHCGSFDYVLNKYPARIVYRPNVEAVGTAANPYVDPGKADLKEGAVQKSTAVYANAVKAMYATTPDFTSVVYVTDPSDPQQTICGGSGDDIYTFTFYTPLSNNYGTKESNAEWNEYSPIMILNYRGYMFAMSGDAEGKNEGEFVKKVADARTDGVTDKYDLFTDDFTVNVIKAGHHGSRTSTSLDYINAITTAEGAQAAYYVISCGAGNKYGHPHSETLQKFSALNVPDGNVLRTDISGDIRFEVKADSGAYALFCNDVKTSAAAGVLPVLPDDYVAPPVSSDGEKVLVYKKLGGMEMHWSFIGWMTYGVVALVVAVHLVITLVRGEDD